MGNAYDEILDLFTSSPTLRQIIDFQHSEATLGRVRYLEAGEDQDTLTPDERNELREFRRAAYVVEQLKIRARRRLDAGGDSQLSL